MRFATTVTAAAILALIGTSAMAQNTAPAAPAPTAATKSTGAMTKQKNPAANTMAAAQSAVAKSCSAQADAKGLHGNARTKFRSQCKKNGGM